MSLALSLQTIKSKSREDQLEILNTFDLGEREKNFLEVARSASEIKLPISSKWNDNLLIKYSLISIWYSDIGTVSNPYLKESYKEDIGHACSEFDVRIEYVSILSAISDDLLDLLYK